MPFDRPPTRAEVWEYAVHWYADLKTEQELKDFARTAWVGNYVTWVNRYGWRNPPDWKEGDDVVREACPTGPILPEQWQRVTYELYGRVQAARRAKAGQLQLEGAAQ